MPTRARKSIPSAKAKASPPSTVEHSAQDSTVPVGYPDFLRILKQRIRQTQIQAARAASQALLGLYFGIGRDLVVRQEREGWGSSVIERLARDLRSEFPGQQGFSASNLWRMRAFYLAYRPPHEVLARAVRELAPTEEPTLPAEIIELPWGHHVVLLERVKESAQRAFYARAALEHGWSRDVLHLQINGKLFERQTGTTKLTNFRTSLPKRLSDLAEQTIKDPYLFDFLTVSDEAHEREIERSLVQHITRFLLKLGTGFSFVGRQVHLQVGGEDFYIDLLFYHLKLRSFVVIELKAGAFKPEHAGQLNFYLSAVDANLRHSTDNPSIGLILCRDKNRTVAEYSLGGMSKPMGVAEWKRALTESLPDVLRTSLPTVEELESELAQLGSADEESEEQAAPFLPRRQS